MRPKKSAQSYPMQHLFEPELEDLVDRNHSLVQLSKVIPWEDLDTDFGEFYVEAKGCPGKPTRLMAGLLYLKYTYDLSDEDVVSRWVENPYWQHFCGMKHFQHRFPIHPSSLTRWRQRIGEAGAEKLLAATVQTGLRTKAVNARSFQKVNVDTTVQEKAVRYPTDSMLYDRMRIELVRLAEQAGIRLRQKYPRIGKKYLRQAARYFHARQMKRGQREVKKLKTLLGRVVRDVVRKIKGNSEWESLFAEALAKAQRVLAQRREDSNKLYSLHAPEVECICKGKAHKRYEFGNKVSVAATSREGFVIGVMGLHGAPYDGHTLRGAIAQAERIIGREITGDVFVDKGYRGHNYQGAATVYRSGMKRLSEAQRRWLRRRSAIEPKIGDMKRNSRMDRNYLKGKAGDKINCILCGCGVNLRKIAAVIRSRSFGPWIRLLRTLTDALKSHFLKPATHQTTWTLTGAMTPTCLRPLFQG